MSNISHSLSPAHSSLNRSFRDIRPEDSYSRIGAVLLYVATVISQIALTIFVFITLPVFLWNTLTPFPIQFIATIHREWFSMVRLILSYSEAEITVEGNSRPIILIHGFMHNASAWNHYIEVLKQQEFNSNARVKFGPIYALTLGGGSFSGKFQSIETYANQVIDKINSVHEQTNRNDIALIGHSMGGLVSVLAANEHVSQVITIGAPLKGAPLACLLPISTNCIQMQVGNEFLNTIENKIVETQDTIEYYHIGSSSDFIVPGENAVREGAPQLIVENLGHASLLFSGPISSAMINRLNMEIAPAIDDQSA
jgi:hypothetical protein